MTQAVGRKRQALASFSWLLVDKVVALGGAAIVNIIVARHLGPNDFGLLNYVVSLAAMAAAVSGLGWSALLARDLSYRPDDEARILGAASVVTTVAMTVVTIAIAIWALTMPPVDSRIQWLLVIVVAMGVFRRYEFLESWFVVHGKVHAYAVARVAMVLLFIGVRVVLLWLGASLQAFVVTLAVETALIGLMSLMAYRMARGAPLKWIWDTSVAIDSLRRWWPVLLAGLTAFIYLRMDVIMLTWWSSPKEAGIYSAAARLSEVWYFVPQLLMNAVFPGLLILRQNDPDQYAQRVQDLLDLLAAAGTLLAVAVTLTAWWFIPLLYGPEYQSAALMLMIHIWAGIFVFMRTVLNKWLVAEELYIFALVTHGSAAIVNVAINIALIPKFGGVGAAVATLVSYATAGFLSLLLHHRTRGLFFMMLKSLMWPRRIGEAWGYGMTFYRSWRRA